MDQKVLARETLANAKSLSVVELAYIFAWLVAMSLVVAIPSRSPDPAIQKVNQQITGLAFTFSALMIGPATYTLVRAIAYKKKVFAEFVGLSDRELADLVDSKKSREWIEREILNRQRKGNVDPAARVKLRWLHLGEKKIQHLIDLNEDDIIEHFRLQREWSDAVHSRPILRSLYASVITLPLLAIWLAADPKIITSEWIRPALLIGTLGPPVVALLMIVFAHMSARDRKRALDDFRKEISNDSLRLLIPFYPGVRELKRRAKMGDDDAKRHHFNPGEG